MLAASAMNGALLDSTFNVFFKLKYDKLYDQMLATPLTTDRHRPRRARLVRCCAAASTPLAFLVVMVGDGPGALVVGGARAARRRC